MLKFKNVTKKYSKVLAANDVSFEVKSGQIGVLLGPNGAGKSTIIKSAAGLLSYNGEIYVNDVDTKTIDGKKEFAYIPEIPTLYDDLTVREHLEFIAKAYKMPDSYKEEIDELLEVFELTERADKLGTELSKGMLQKVSICMALITHPSCILVDEPMVGLDPKAIKRLKEIFKDLAEKGTTILISTHMMEMVEDIWDVMVVLKKGEVLGTFTREDLQDESMKQFFFELTEGGEADGSN